jgi:hypothetical protein
VPGIEEGTLYPSSTVSSQTKNITYLFIGF